MRVFIETEKKYVFFWKDVLVIGVSLFLLIVSSKLKLYFIFSPVPVTFQNLVIFLTFAFFGEKALLSILAWIGLGLGGFPVFAGGGGPLYFLGPTGGYIIGFILAGLFLKRIIHSGKSLFFYVLIFSLANLLIYFSGLLWLVTFLKFPFEKAILSGVLPFLYPDALKIILASLVVRLFISKDA